jgi:hypothetical protein
VEEGSTLDFSLVGDGAWTNCELLAELRDRHSLAPWIEAPTELREALVEWRPVLGEVEGLMAKAQHLLLSRKIDRVRGDGITASWQTVLRSFGFEPKERATEAISAQRLLRLYHDVVDPGLKVRKYASSKERARTVVATGFPTEVLDLARRTLVTPSDFSGWVYLIDGKSTSRRNSSEVYCARKDETEEHTSKIEPPEAAKKIQRYLNTGFKQTMGHGGHGIFRTSKVESVIEEISGDLSTERGLPLGAQPSRDQALRTLYCMRSHPVPLYRACDYSPRLKTGPCNQLPSLNKSVLRRFYSPRDVELDFDKMHLSVFAKTAEDMGYEVPVLKDHLKTSLAGEIDLWEELASCFGEDSPTLQPPAKRLRSSTAWSSDPAGTTLPIASSNDTQSSRATSTRPRPSKAYSTIR